MGNATNKLQTAIDAGKTWAQLLTTTEGDGTINDLVGTAKVDQNPGLVSRVPHGQVNKDLMNLLDDAVKLAYLGQSLHQTLDETVDCTTPAANFDLTADIPTGAAILAVRANLETAITGAGGATKVGVGLTADPDKYGLTSVLTKNAKITTLRTDSPLGGSEDVRVYACDNAGAAAGTIGGAGESIRVQIVYRKAIDLPDAT